MNTDKNLTSNYVQSYYDTFLSSYDKEYSYYRWQAGPVEKLHFRQTRATLVPYLTTLRGAVLEIGGGDAIWTRHYIEQVESLTFLDISSQMIARAQKRLASFADKISYLNQDFLTAEFREASFDHVVSIRNLEYFTDKQAFLLKVKKSLKTGGTFVLVTKSPTYHKADTGKRKTLHTSQIDIVELLSVMRSQGFMIEAVYPAIFGKLFRVAPVRFVMNVAHRIIRLLPWRILPLRLLARFSESFLIYAKA